MSSSKDQLNLFASAVEKTGESVDPCQHDSELVSLSKSLPPQLYLGTSSWAFEGWKGLVYAECARSSELSRKGLLAYAQHPLFNAVGIDRSYYGAIGIDEFRGYAQQVPDDFRFLVKAGQVVTSPVTAGPERAPNPHFFDAGWTSDYIVRPYVEGLDSKAGVLLLQLPPIPQGTFSSPESFADRLYAYLSKLPKGARYALELRNAAFFTQRYAEALKATGVSHCYNVHPSMPPLARQVGRIPLDSGPLIIRWMLREGMSFEQARERYAPFDGLIDHDQDTRALLVKLIAEMVEKGSRVMVIVNNKAEGCSPASIIELARAWERRRERVKG